MLKITRFILLRRALLYTFLHHAAKKYTIYNSPIALAWSRSSSRKSGCARRIMALTRSSMERTFRFTQPYSVTTYCTSERGVVTADPAGKLATIRLLHPLLPFRVLVSAIKDFPPLDSYAPRT